MPICNVLTRIGTAALPTVFAPALIDIVTNATGVQASPVGVTSLSVGVATFPIVVVILSIDKAALPIGDKGI